MFRRAVILAGAAFLSAACAELAGPAPGNSAPAAASQPVAATAPGGATQPLILVRPKIIIQREEETKLFGPDYDRPSALPRLDTQPVRPY